MTYIIDRDPNRFGGQQEDFITRSQTIVNDIVSKIRGAVDGNKDLTKLFIEMIDSLGQERNKIAVDHRTNNANDFGLLRPQNGNGFFLTDLKQGSYLEYCIKMNKRINKELAQNPCNKAVKITYTSCCERDSNMQYYPLGKAKYSQLLTAFNDNLRHLFALGEIPWDPKGSTSLLFNNKEALRKIKNKSLEDYKDIKLLNIFYYTSLVGQPCNSTWVHGTLRCSVNGKMYALSQYLQCTDPKKPLYSRLIIIHQDDFLVEDTLNDIAQVFKKAILCLSEDLKGIKRETALFKYLFAHAAPYYRGSAAISEWIERALYAYHGYRLTYNSNKMSDLEALTSPLNEFMEAYDTIVDIHLQPR